MHASVALLASALLLAVAPTAAAPPRPLTFDEVDYGFAEDERDIVVDGLRLRVVESGPEDGPRVLLLHCFGLSLQVWREVMPALARAGFHVVAYDAPGHGKSARPTRPLRLARLAQIATGVLDELGWQRAHLVGNSMGGGTALFVALDAPTRVDRLVLVDAVGLDLRMWYGRPWLALGPRDMAGASDWLWRFGFNLAVEQHAPLALRVREELVSTRADPEAARAAFNFKTIVDDMVVIDRTADLARLGAPTLVVTGAHDRLVDPDHARRLNEGIRGSRLLVYPDLGHLPELEDAPRVAADIERFLLPSSSPATP